jgi:hypothetical protein
VAGGDASGDSTGLKHEHAIFGEVASHAVLGVVSVMDSGDAIG